MPKVLFFTAGPVATPEELDAIAAAKASFPEPFELGVRNGMESSAYGSGVEACDFVLGEAPGTYAVKPVYEAGGGTPPIG